MTRTAHVQRRQECSDQQQRQTQSEEKLRSDEEIGQQDVVNNVIFFLKDPPTAVKSGVVEVTRVLETSEANLP